MKTVAENKNFTAIELGKLALLPETANGKAFLKEATKASGTEISLSVLPAKTDLPIFHSHKQNEETYIVLSGAGKFQVDDQCFDIAEGSIVRVAPAGVRGMTNTSDEQMNYIVIQSKESSLEQCSMEDGIIDEATSLWK
ncbi:mannose-6-phosphate isomerase-like protein (cupin superfamily) [Parabacteroides sp. PF5-5]|uniref:cupin domain-containing protein n=1 Tax=unclassified Parabacteroides TaxID=2649774 RepID=UPI0024731CE6|nr:MULTISPECIES: cupin domain-containing protein [unclassified Parabacteroides]MDH6305173.1 mannose-6-phosphate isomerase-like protein (cupin superfamily) [Parabacteroides sp. PH5-39]MDH6316523.1 mannose-6-phosphate isomerase-like protein (cupin superfamily) [Parabacteroides sp. PF5-13]MDH6320033.1 mannose-6-phosphate isomerase-like protein (cupin superfamily) [Parabacteroides sp. PH5-13]MDH6323734.1 mannose-6-phosphate isomerase-like protein (cupin superfamily) [Parabacteroides sp. PH5-8]MDH6